MFVVIFVSKNHPIKVHDQKIVLIVINKLTNMEEGDLHVDICQALMASMIRLV